MQDSTENATRQLELEEIELLSFRIGQNEYSVDIMSVREIRGWTRTTSTCSHWFRSETARAE